MDNIKTKHLMDDLKKHMEKQDNVIEHLHRSINEYGAELAASRAFIGCGNIVVSELQAAFAKQLLRSQLLRDTISGLEELVETQEREIQKLKEVEYA